MCCRCHEQALSACVKLHSLSLYDCCCSEPKDMPVLSALVGLRVTGLICCEQLDGVPALAVWAR